MVFYDINSVNELKDKFGYELWILNFIINKKHVLNSEISPNFFYYDDKQLRKVLVQDFPGSGILKEFLENISPLIFLTCYKIIDVIFEWILEEHEMNGVINKVPWNFKEKIDEIDSLIINGNINTLQL